MSVVGRLLVMLGLKPRRHRRRTPCPVASPSPAPPPPGAEGRVWSRSLVPARVSGRARPPAAARLSDLPETIDPSLDEVDDELLRIAESIP